MNRFDEYLNRGEGRMRPVGLLDADHTLVYTISADKTYNGADVKDEGVGEDVYNLDLLNELKVKGIRDIYLFTDMIFTQRTVFDRIKMIQFLVSQGFNVLGVITPNDYFWRFNRKRLQEFQEALGAANVVLNEFCQKNLDKIPEILARFPEIAAEVKNTDSPVMGEAFKEVSNPSILEDQDKMKEINLHSIACKTAIDIITHLKGMESCKAIMCQQFIEHKPKFVSSCYVFDDIKRNLTAINRCEHGGFPVHTVHGSFPEKEVSFIGNFIFHPEELSVESRLYNVVLLAFEEIKLLQSKRTLGALFYKKEAGASLALLTKIKGCNDTFEEEWAVILAHFRSIPKGLFGGYPLSIFDIKLLEYLSADEVIFTKIGVQAYQINRKRDPQNFLEKLLSTDPQGHHHSEQKSLHSSYSRDIQLPSLRSSASIRLLSSNRPATIRGSHAKTVRVRSSSEAPLPVDMAIPSVKPKSASEELVNKDRLLEDTKSKSSSEDLLPLNKDNIAGLVRSLTTQPNADDTPPRVSPQGESTNVSDEDTSSDSYAMGMGQ